MGRGGGWDKVRECWPPVATVPEPVLSAGILRCSGSTCRPLKGTDRCCTRGAEIYSQSQMRIIIIDLKRCMVHFFAPQIASIYPARSGCIICIWFSSLLLSALSSCNQQQRHKHDSLRDNCLPSPVALSTMWPLLWRQVIEWERVSE